MDWESACTKSPTGEAKRKGTDTKGRLSWIYVKKVDNNKGYRLRQMMEGIKTIRPSKIFNKHPEIFDDWQPARYA